MNKKLARLSLTAALVLMMLVSVTGIALAFDSGGNPGGTGSNHIEWTGQGTTDGELNTPECPSGDVVPQGIDPNSYLHWIFTTDGGSAENAVLHLGGSGSGDYVGTGTGGAFHFFTPFFDLDTLTASATFDVTASGNGAWILTISHGCAGETIEDLTVSKTAEASYTRTFNWTIDKNADKDTVYSAGGGESGAVHFTIDVTKDDGTDSDFVVSGTITVNNPNSFAVNGVDISDSIPDGDCSVDDASLDVAAGATASTDYTCEFDSNPGSGTNTATATWPEIGSPNSSANGTADFTFGDPTTLVNDEVDVTDTNGGSWHFTESGSVSYDQTYTDPAGTCTEHTNTATITQTGDDDSVTVQDCQGADLVVTKTANPSYDLKYAWTIDKSVVGASSRMVDAGQPATFSYNITVSHDAGTQSNWTVNGKITVSNPNDWQAIVADVSDSLSGGTCSVTGGDDVNVPASGAVELNYSCTFTGNPGSGTNTATATWDASAAHTPSGSDSGTAGFDFANAAVNAIDECVTVVDDKATPGNTSDDVTLGTVCVGDANPKAFSYSLTFTGPAAGTCANFTNTARFTTNDTGATGSDSETVRVCSFQAALTPGYWKTHLALNGTSGCTGLPSGTGCSSNGPFTKTYLPKTLGGYNVDTILKAAQVFAAMNCSNTGSNSAQNQNATGCLAGHLLAAKLNVANGANTCIAPTIAAADALLSSVPYTGPSGTYTGISLSTRNNAIALKNALDAYNNGTGCH